MRHVSRKTQAVLSILLCFTLWMKIGVSSDASTKLRNIINKIVEVKTDAENKYVTNVSGYLIYMHNFKTNKKNKDLKVNIFFIQMNCRFNDWTQYHLYNFIQKFSLFLQNNKNYNKFKSDKETHINVLTNIENDVKRFVYILHNFLEIFGSYYDTTLLKTLILLQFKIEYIIYYVNNIRLLKLGITDAVIVNILLKIMIDIQYFKTLTVLSHLLNYTPMTLLK